MASVRVLATILLFGWLWHVPRAVAEPIILEDRTIPVAKHERKTSKVKLEATELTASAKPGQKATRVPATVVEYLGPLLRLPSGAGTYDVKPNCKASNVKRSEVRFDTEELAYFDILLYNYHDGDQTARARTWDRPTAPFLEGDMYNPFREQGNLQQEVGRFLGIECLPTRVHYPIIGGRRYEELREGASAWDTSD
ncbi:MAG: hypothetical protein U0136_13765 [Bdellovibrionota bacterium]